MTDTVVDDVYDASKKEVTGLRLRNLKTGEQWDFPTSAMFLGIGHTPNAEFVGDQLQARWRGIPACRPMDTSAPKCPAFSSPGTWLTAIIVRRSPRPAPAAWQRCEVEKYLEEIGK